MEATMPSKNIELLDDVNLIHKTDLDLEKSFKPKGAIAFFILLIMLCLAVWYGIYFLMLQRN